MTRNPGRAAGRFAAATRRLELGVRVQHQGALIALLALILLGAWRYGERFAVGYPGGVSVAYDMATCRLAYAWSGNFLDASPAWNDRGGSPANLLGPRFWLAPPGCPRG